MTETILTDPSSIGKFQSEGLLDSEDCPIHTYVVLFFLVRIAEEIESTFQ